MQKIWMALMAASVFVGLLGGHVQELEDAVLTSGEDAVKLVLTLLGAMPVWCGLMEILEETGDLNRIGKVFRRFAKPLFPCLEDEECWSAMCVNLSANVLGLGNAATPAGIRAASLLARHGEVGLRALAMLLALDNASLQLIPTTVITLRRAAGAPQPADIWLPTLIVSGVSSVAACGLMLLVQRGGGKHGHRFQVRGWCIGGHCSSQGPDDAC